MSLLKPKRVGSKSIDFTPITAFFNHCCEISVQRTQFLSGGLVSLPDWTKPSRGKPQ